MIRNDLRQYCINDGIANRETNEDAGYWEKFYYSIQMCQILIVCRSTVYISGTQWTGSPIPLKAPGEGAHERRDSLVWLSCIREASFVS